MEIPVYYQEKDVGLANVAAEGLYTRVSVTARGLPEKILRAWAILDGGTVLPLGVLAPEGEMWRTSRKFSTASLPGPVKICEISSEIPEKTEPAESAAQAETKAPAECADSAENAAMLEQDPPVEQTQDQTQEETQEAAQSEAAAWRDFDGAALHCQTPGARCRPRAGGLEIQLPYDPAIPCELVPLFCFFTIEEADGRLWLRLYLDEHGEPVLPAPAGT